MLSEEKTFTKLKREIELFEKVENTLPLQRDPIPEDVRIFVWRRDEGRCVSCGSQERIEFDHIIPLEKGGSSTTRNIQVLCEQWNREKRHDRVNGRARRESRFRIAGIYRYVYSGAAKGQ